MGSAATMAVPLRITIGQRPKEAAVQDRKGPNTGAGTGASGLCSRQVCPL